MTCTIGGASLIALMTSGAFGQSAPSPPAFEAVTIRPHDGPPGAISGFSCSGARVTLEAYTPMSLIMDAYRLKNYQVSFAPSTARPEQVYYDITAKPAGGSPPTRERFRQMLQSLLAERFKLRFHRGARKLAVYALMVDKNGPKFKSSAPDAEFVVNGGRNGRSQFMKASKAEMDYLVDAIRNLVDRPVVDKTGLAGTYDFTLNVMLDFRLQGVTVGTAVRDQLGLKLATQEAVVEVLVVDHIEKPGAN